MSTWPLWRGLLPQVPPGPPEDVALRREQALLADLLSTMPPPRLAPQHAWPHHDALAAAVRAQDREGLRDVLALAELGTDKMMVLRDAAAELPTDVARTWAVDEPDDPDALLLAAASLVVEAATERADQAPDDLDEFRRMSVDACASWAAEHCARAAELLPDDPTPWLLAQHTLPLAATREDVLAAAQRWQAIDELSYVGNLTLMGQLSGARVGEPDDTLDLARRLSRRTRRQHLVHSLVPVALVDRFVVRASTLTADEARAEMRQHQNLLLAAYARCVGAPRWRRTWLDPAARNQFAFCFFLTDLDDEAWREIVALEGQVTVTPWQILDEDPVTAWDDARTWLALRWLRGDISRRLTWLG